MSNKSNNEYLGRFLNAEELLKSRGIKCIAWEEWEKASFSLPKVGQKRYEPNGSWLENNAVQNGINMRKDLLNLEKVDRISNLATAEWLSYQKKAKVTKMSGQAWSNFGHVINSELYLIPEEALLLLEMNNLELYWKGVPLSIQQAYKVLFESNDDVEYTLDHYRVYRQLVKEGYHLQRYIKKLSNDSRHSVGKKVIIEPENGLRMTKASLVSIDVEMDDVSSKEKQLESTLLNQNSVNDNSESTSRDKDKSKENTNEETEICSNNIPSPDKISNMEVCEIPNVLQNKQENNSSNENSKSISNENKKKKTNKVEIISDEIVLENIQIAASNTTKWPGSRIQRNVKLMPKRNNKNIPANNIESKDITIVNSNEGSSRKGEKRRINSEHHSSKKAREEVIDISDDEEKDVHRPLTKMEILNQLPDIAANPVTVIKIKRGYIPHSIKPKDVYYFRKSKWMNCQSKIENSSSSKAVTPYRENSQHHATNSFNSRSNVQQQNYNILQQYNRFAHQTQQWFNRNTFYQHNISHYNQRHSFNYQSTFNYNVLFGVMQNVMRSVQMSVRYRNPFQATVQQNVHFSYQQNTQHEYYNARSNFMWRSRINPNHPNFQRNPRTSSDIVDITTKDEVNIPSFTKRPNVSTWAELKEKWLDEKTITIDDEEPSDVDGEVEVLKQSVKPLLKVSGPMNFSEIYEKLRIIKSAPDVSVRKKSSDYSLSYNVYLSSQPYKKANPGIPVFRILVLRAQNNPYMDLKKLTRLQEEMKEVPIIIAHVSNTITYVQPGFVSLQNWY